MDQRAIKIGLFGFGCVGQGLYDVLRNSRNFSADIKKIVVKNPDKPRSLPDRYFYFDKEAILDDPEINLVVELISDPQEAYHIVKKALQQGKDVVSANKKMIAEHFEELVELQRAHGVSLLYEASACASIPIIRTLEEYYDNETLYAVHGIFNGSSNYVLSKMYDEGWDYGKALAEAQQKGFAEADPTLDVGGFDAKYKLLILAAHSFGLFLQPEQIYHYGIQTLNAFDIRYAKEKGCKIKLVARVAKVEEDAVACYVMPALVGTDSSLFGVDQEYNGVVVEAAFSDKQFFRGKGAGGHPTGSAVLSDISATRYHYRYEYRKHNDNNEMRLSNEVSLKVYMRYSNGVVLREEKFSRIYERYESCHGNHYVIAEVELSTLMQDSYFAQEGLFLCQLQG